MNAAGDAGVHEFHPDGLEARGAADGVFVHRVGTIDQHVTGAKQRRQPRDHAFGGGALGQHQPHHTGRRELEDGVRG